MSLPRFRIRIVPTGFSDPLWREETPDIEREWTPKPCTVRFQLVLTLRSARIALGD